MKWSTKPKEGGAVYDVRVTNGEETEVITSKDEIFQHVSRNLSKRFRLAFTAKCYSGKLFDDIGFLGNTEDA
jgi:hypothetical protein